MVHGCWRGYLPVGYVCLLALQLVCGPVHSNDAADAMQALGFEDGHFSLDRLCRRDFETQLPSCRRRGTGPPCAGTWIPGCPGPGGSLDRQAGVITRSRHTWDGEKWCLRDREGPANPGKCLEVLGPARTSWNITNGHGSSLGIPPFTLHQPASQLGPCRPELPDYLPNSCCVSSVCHLMHSMHSVHPSPSTPSAFSFNNRPRQPEPEFKPAPCT